MSGNEKAGLQRNAVIERQHRDEKLTSFFGGLIPVVMSFLFHMGLLLIMLFVVFLAETEVNTEKIDIPNEVFSEAPVFMLTQSRTQKKELTKKPRKPVRGVRINIDIDKTFKRLDLIGIDQPLGSESTAGLPDISSGPVQPGIFEPNGPVGNMRHVVYVIDRSGSMVAYFPDVIGELCRSLEKLNGKEQDYHVILFAEGQPLEKSPKRLVPATRKNARETAKWLEKNRTCGGNTKAIPALKRAFAVLEGRTEGSLIYLLTDGNFNDPGGNANVLGYINSKNKDKKVHINTFLYGTRPEQAVEVMEKIAAQNGGQYRFVEDQE